MTIFMKAIPKILLPMVGMVVTISPSFNLYKIVVFPAASSPTKRGNESKLYKWKNKSESVEAPSYPSKSSSAFYQIGE